MTARQNVLARASAPFERNPLPFFGDVGKIDDIRWRSRDHGRYRSALLPVSRDEIGIAKLPVGKDAHDRIVGPFRRNRAGHHECGTGCRAIVAQSALGDTQCALIGDVSRYKVDIVDGLIGHIPGQEGIANAPQPSPTDAQPEEDAAKRVHGNHMPGRMPTQTSKQRQSRLPALSALPPPKQIVRSETLMRHTTRNAFFDMNRQS